MCSWCLLNGHASRTHQEGCISASKLFMTLWYCTPESDAAINNLSVLHFIQQNTTTLPFIPLKRSSSAHCDEKDVKCFCISERGTQWRFDTNSIEVWTLAGAPLCEECQALIHGEHSLVQGAGYLVGKLGQCCPLLFGSQVTGLVEMLAGSSLWGETLL